MRREAVNAIALVDFGSTFTKLTITEAGTGRLLAAAQAPTTVETDVMEGYRDALDRALRQVPGKPKIVRRLAASSAGGGLRVAAIGLVPEYTEAAARQAALNAGARIVLRLAGRLDERAVTALEEAQPEIVLFSGGTDGGQRAQVLENAEAISAARIESRIVVACNRDVAAAVADMLAPTKRVRTVANVLPAIGRLDIEPARAAIHDEFIRHVIRGKGLSHAQEFHEAVIMPTPEAVLRATRLLATAATGRGPPMSSWSTSAGRRPTFTPPSRLSLHLSGFARPACRRSPSGAPWRAISACAGARPAFWTRTETGSRQRAVLPGTRPSSLGTPVPGASGSRIICRTALTRTGSTGRWRPPASPTRSGAIADSSAPSISPARARTSCSGAPIFATSRS